MAVNEPRFCVCSYPIDKGHFEKRHHSDGWYADHDDCSLGDHEFPPTTTHPDNPCATTLIKALTVVIHKLKAYQNKETANQPVDKAELTAILAFLREHLKTI